MAKVESTVTNSFWREPVMEAKSLLEQNYAAKEERLKIP